MTFLDTFRGFNQRVFTGPLPSFSAGKPRRGFATRCAAWIGKTLANPATKFGTA
jgi:hypothetical protein